MNDLLRAFTRAVASMLHPRMLWLTFLPFLVAAGGWGVVFWFAWQDLVGAARSWLPVQPSVQRSCMPSIGSASPRCMR